MIYVRLSPDEGYEHEYSIGCHFYRIVFSGGSYISHQLDMTDPFEDYFTESDQILIHRTTIFGYLFGIISVVYEERDDSKYFNYEREVVIDTIYSTSKRLKNTEVHSQFTSIYTQT